MMRLWRGVVGTPNIEDCSAAFEVLAAAGLLVPVDLYDVGLVQLGYPEPMWLRWASSRYDVPFPGPRPEADGLFHEHVYAGGERYVGSPITISSPRPNLTGTIKQEVGVSSDTLALELLLEMSPTTGLIVDTLPPADGNPSTPTMTISEAVDGGIFEGALVIQRRLYLATHPEYPIIHGHPSLPSSFDTSAGAYTRFVGQCTKWLSRRSRATLNVKSLPEKWALGLPRHVRQPSCRFQTYDLMCRVSPLGTSPIGPVFRYDSNLSVVTSLWQVSATTPLLAFADDWFSPGLLIFTSGKLAGFRAPIRKHTASFAAATFTFLTPLPALPQVGDGVRFLKQCVKSETACRDVFANFIDPGDTTKGLRFGGMPAIPRAEDSA